jgi:LmbE family N-acetylglucosaminyl deacetylase
MSSDFSDMFHDAALVVAHPDDEALWFSSILERMNEIIICFMDVVSRADWSEGRRRSIASYPIENATFLGLQESEVFYGADWLAPVLTHYGLEVSKKNNSFPGFSAKRYRKNYEEIREQLSMRLRSRRNVFTHNPWGDYGHEEHVQVFRAIQDLQQEFGFNLWFSNYCSSKSYNLMLRYVYGFDSSYVTVETDQELGKSLMQLYQRNNCWTWYEDYSWFTHECFMLFNRGEVSARSPGHIFPLNFIKVGIPRDREGGLESIPFARKITRRLRRLTE